MGRRVSPDYNAEDVVRVISKRSVMRRIAGEFIETSFVPTPADPDALLEGVEDKDHQDDLRHLE